MVVKIWRHIPVVTAIVMAVAGTEVWSRAHYISRVRPAQNKNEGPLFQREKHTIKGTKL